MSPIISGGSSGGASPVMAAVKLSAPIAGWDGSPIPFDSVLTDPDGLWDSAQHQFVVKAAGWYEVSTFGTTNTPLITSSAIASAGTVQMAAIVYGAGDNLQTEIGQHTAVADGIYPFPPITGLTHLDVGDGIDIECSAVGVTLNVPAGFGFTIERLRAT